MILDSVLNTRTKSTVSKKGTSEKIKRSVVKTLSWRAVGTIDTILISWLLTGALTLALSIGAVELITKMILYFVHERVWNSIKWGK